MRWCGSSQLDLEYPDGGNPPDAVLYKFLRVRAFVDTHGSLQIHVHSREATGLSLPLPLAIACVDRRASASVAQWQCTAKPVWVAPARTSLRT